MLCVAAVDNRACCRGSVAFWMPLIGMRTLDSNDAEAAADDEDTPRSSAFWTLALTELPVTRERPNEQALRKPPFRIGLQLSGLRVLGTFGSLGPQRPMVSGPTLSLRFSDDWLFCTAWYVSPSMCKL